MKKIYFDLFLDITHAQGGYDIGDNSYTLKTLVFQALNLAQRYIIQY